MAKSTRSHVARTQLSLRGRGKCGKRTRLNESRSHRHDRLVLPEYCAPEAKSACTVCERSDARECNDMAPATGSLENEDGDKIGREA